MKTQEKLISLDVLRGLACLLVWISHVRVATQYLKAPRYDFIQVFSAWGKESVVIFFMLSGIVINLSSGNRTHQGQYFIRRFIRIYPIYLSVLLICFLCDHFVLGHPVNARIFIGNLLLSATLQGYHVQTMPLNPAVWSITCEAFFYLIFGLIYKLNRLKYVWIWFAVCCLSIVYKILTDDSTHAGIVNHFIFLLNNSFLWILGYLVFEYRDKFHTTLPIALCGVLMIPLVTRLHQLPGNLHEVMYSLAGIYLLPLFIHLLRNEKTVIKETIPIGYSYIVPVYIISIILLWRFSNSLSGSKVIYSVLPFLSFILYSGQITINIKRLYHKSKSFFGFFADISYPLYLLHMPVMYMVFHFIPDQKLTGIALSICITIALSYLFEKYIFKMPARLLNTYISLRPARVKQVQS